VIVDSSAIVLAAAERVSAGAPTVVESSVVLCSRLGHTGKTLLARFLQEAEIEVVEFAADHWTSRPRPTLPTARAATALI
jgi:uncharacterized protein with PIN domain